MGGRGSSSGLGIKNITGVRKMQKGIQTKKKLVKEHIGYIRNPKIKYENWDAFSDDRKARELNHWKKELVNFRNEINRSRKEIKKFNEHKG